MEWLRKVCSRGRRYDELSESIREHLDEKIADLMDRGMTQEQAESAARREFGNVTRIEERSREVWQWPTLESIWADVKYAIRQLTKSPAFATTAVLTLALGIGATTAIFTLVHAVLLKSLPVVNPRQLYRVGDIENCCAAGGLQDDWSLFSDSLYRYFRDHTPGFDQLAAMDATTNLVVVRRSSSQSAQPMVNEFVSGNYFSTFGLTAYQGRMLTNEDDQVSAAPVAVMNFHTWQQKYNADPSVVGSSFDIDGHPFTVIGITPPGFFGDRLQQNPPSFWIPLADEPLLLGSNSILNRPDLHWLDLIGRIRPEVNPATLQSQMQVELRQWLLSSESRLDTGERGQVSRQILRLTAGGGGIRVMQEKYESGLRLLMWISVFVLAIVCANLAHLMLVRASSRRQLSSVRAALGASRGRLIRQAITESIVLAALGGTAGLVVAFAGTKMILHLAFRNAYVPINATPELAVLIFAFVAVLLTGLLFGIAPAWIMQRANPAEALRGAARSTRSRTSLAQKALVVGQAALSLVLLCAAGLLTASLENIQHQNFGFDTTNRYILHIDPQMAGYPPQKMEALYRQLQSTLEAIPGINGIGVSLYSPMDGVNPNETVYIAGQAPPPPDSSQNNASWDRVIPGYFSTIGTKLTQGRSFSEDDSSGTQKVAVVNQAFVRRFFKNENAIGKHFGTGSVNHATDYEIVGVTENTQYQSPTEQIPPMYFLPFAQAPNDGSRFLDAIEIWSGVPQASLERQIRSVVAQAAPNLTILDIGPFADQVNATLQQQTMIARLTSLFGFLALILAGIGLYGVTAYLVEQHTNEIGIRMALGATRPSVLRLVLKGAFLQVGIGLVVGVPMTILAGRAMSSQLFGVKPYDPLVLSSTILILGIATFIAAIIPARRAAAIDPMQALRSE